MDMTNMGDMKMPMPMQMMKMYFHTGYEDHILFKEWTAHSDGSVFGWCAFFFVLTLAYELLKYYRQIHLANATCALNSTIMINSEDNGTANNSSATQDSHIESCDTTRGDKYERPLHSIGAHKRRTLSMLSTAHIIQTVLHMIQIFVSYILMLAFMLFNIWICLAVILGAGVGYFLVGSRKLTAYSDFDDDHCH